MIEVPRRISLQEWDDRYSRTRDEMPDVPSYVGRLGRHAESGDRRLHKLCFDNSPAALRLWNFLLTEDERLHEARRSGQKIVGAMKDLGTVPVMAFSSPRLTAFYPDGAWWIPCVMEGTAGLLEIADSLGIDESFCPVRAMLGAFQTGEHFPLPDLLVCSTGATCDDFTAIAQRLEHMGHRVNWWEIPSRRAPEDGEEAVPLPGGVKAPRSLVDFVVEELRGVRTQLEQAAGEAIDDGALRAGIRGANEVRRLLADLRRVAYTAEPCPLPALEMLVAEMLALHFCSDRSECAAVLRGLLAEVNRRADAGIGVSDPSAARVFWVNPVADLRAMNLLEECGARLSGTEYLFCHALDPIAEDLDPLDALARTALADPMAGSAFDRAERICRDAAGFRAEGVVISRIPGASHCATEGRIIRFAVEQRLGLPVVEIEVPPLCDSLHPSLRTRLEALVETIRARRVEGKPVTQGADA